MMLIIIFLCAMFVVICYLLDKKVREIEEFVERLEKSNEIGVD